MLSRHRMGMILGFWVLTLPDFAGAQENDLSAIQHAIAQKGANWKAGETSVSGLSWDEKKKRCGALQAPVFSRRLRHVLFAPRLDLPEFLDWRDNNGNFVTPVRNQGSCGSCWAFAATAVFESTSLIEQNLPGVEFNRSEQDVLSCSGAGSCLGGGGEGALQYIATLGVVDEDCFPYGGADQPCYLKCPDWTKRVLRSHQPFSVDPVPEQIKAALLEAPVIVYLTVYEDFYSYSGGIYEHVWGNPVAGHVVALIGYDDRNQAWICKNSWGDGWGEQGFVRIRYGDSSMGGGVTGLSKNHPPRWDPLYTQTSMPNQLLTFTVSAKDPEGDGVRFEMKAPAGMETAWLDPDTGRFQWIPLEGSQGVYLVTFIAWDDWNPAASSTQSVRISVCNEPCDDLNPCTDDLCPDGTCIRENNQNICPDDNNPCTDDQCRNGSCYFFLEENSPCSDDGNECTQDICQQGNCAHLALENGTWCQDDTNPCSEDKCTEGLCEHVLYPEGTPCDDGSECTHLDQCVQGECMGKIPEACIDGLECTFDECQVVGPHFRLEREPFVDISSNGTDTGINGDDQSVGPFPIGFDYRPPGSENAKTEFWVSSNGFVGFLGPSIAYKDSCFPAPDEPNDLIAPYWDDLECYPDQGCRVTYMLANQPPDRQLIVQWTRAKVYGIKDATVTFELILSEQGGMQFRYEKLSGINGMNASVGWENADGSVGATFQCGGSELRDGMSLGFTEENTECINWPMKGACAIDGKCYFDGEPNPENPCQLCQPWLNNLFWSDNSGNPCDDQISCTTNDSCLNGVCVGSIPQECQDKLDCTLNGCDDVTGCTRTILEGFCLIGGVCVQNGEINPGNSCQQCLPDNSSTSWSDVQMNCDDGDPCTRDDVCAQGQCQGTPYGCPTGDCIQWVKCDGLGGCRYQLMPEGASCGEPKCQNGFLDLLGSCDAEGSCLPGSRRSCEPYTCLNSAACGTSCSYQIDCVQGFFCDLSTSSCEPLKSNGEACQGNHECLWAHCQNGVCCIRGDCCTDDDDCPDTYSLPASCDDPPRCQGHQGLKTCNALQECETRYEENDSACTQGYRFSCQGIEIVCNGLEQQTPHECLVPCRLSEDCPIDEECRGGVCQPLRGIDHLDHESGCGCGRGLDPGEFWFDFTWMGLFLCLSRKVGMLRTKGLG